jgi:hypothetical protein
MVTETGSLVGKVSSMAWSSLASRFSCEFSGSLLSGGHSAGFGSALSGVSWLLVPDAFDIRALQDAQIRLVGNLHHL